MDGPKNVMQLRLPGRKAHFLSGFFVIEVGAHHIYDDTGFCHNYRHRSVICMTEKKFVRPRMSRSVSFFCSAGSVDAHLITFLYGTNTRNHSCPRHISYPTSVLIKQTRKLQAGSLDAHLIVQERKRRTTKERERPGFWPSQPAPRLYPKRQPWTKHHARASTET